MSNFLGRNIQLFAAFIIGFLAYPAFILGHTNISSFIDSLIPECVGIIFTVVLIDRSYRHYDDSKLKRQLIERLGSRNNITAVTAAEELWASRWWADGSLSKAQLEHADLRGADLGKANLTGTRLMHPRYGQTKFDENSIMPDETYWTPDTVLDQYTDPNHPNYWLGFNLSYKNLRGRIFSYKNLRNADMRRCNARGVRFKGADMRGVQLQNSNLTDAVMIETQFDENTVLPDGKYWHPNISLEAYGIIVHED